MLAATSLTHSGSKVIEILPAVDWTLARCAEWILDRTCRELGAVTRVVYLGDDWIDEPLFEALAGHGVTIRVGDGARASRAAYHFERVAHVHELLAALADRVSRQ